MDIIFPQDADSIDKTFYNYQSPYFYEFTEINNVTTPNKVIAYGMVDPDLDWTDTGNLITGEAATESAQLNKYMEVIEYHQCPNLDNQVDCNTRAEVILERLQNHDVTGIMVIPHDTALELYDYIAIVDSRGH
jgi:hypothetical protein